MPLQHKVLFGYFIMVAVIVSMAAILIYERRQMQEVEGGVARLWQMHGDIHTAHRYITGLALQGEVAMGWNNAERDDYHTLRIRTDSLLYALEKRGKEYVPKREIDTLRRLLAEKETMLVAMMEAHREQQKRNAIGRKLAKELPGAVKEATRMRKVTVKKKGIAGWLGGKKTVQVAPDADRLHELNERVTDLHSRHSGDFDTQMDSLTAKNDQLNRRLVGLVNGLDDVAEAIFLQHGKELDSIRVESFKSIASMSGVAIVLLVLSSIVICRDIRKGAQKKAERDKLIADLQETTHKNEELIKARRNIMQTVAHELRTPLTAICGNAELIKSSHDQVDMARRAETIRQSSGQMAAMIDSLLNYFRIDSGKETVCPKPFPLRSIGETLEAEFLPQTDGKGLEFVVDNRVDEVVEGDKGLLLRIGDNLLSNAVKFTEHGRIRLVTDYLNGTFTLMVEDTGSGMGKESTEKIFNPFERLSNAATQDGFGLGLAIVDNLVKMMGGDITVESELGQGSRFTVSLPMPLADLSKVNMQNKRINHEHLSGYSVVVIDDNDVLLGMIRDMFASCCIDCDTCHNAGELTERMRTRDYDLVITDLKMPEMNGYDILELLRLSDIGNSRTVPVAVVTASGSVTEEELLAAGFTACLFKPYSVDDLLYMAERAIGQGANDYDNHIETPDFSALLGFGDKKSILERVVTETENDMAELERLAGEDNVRAMSDLVHKMRSSWMLMRVEGVLRKLYEALHKGDSTKEERMEAINAVSAQGNAIIQAAKRMKGAEA